jgi:phosphatidylserine/phosphatidylglycerophosphate/cardiolipin synthase-like enzyme
MNDAVIAEQAPPRTRFRKRWVAWGLLLACIATAGWNMLKPLPAGANLSTPPLEVPHGEVKFLYDLTHADARGRPVYEQQIFDEAFRIVDGAASFIVADFFLLNDVMGAAGAVHRPLSRQLADRLVARKAANPKLSVLLVTDPINDVYGGAPSPLLAELRAAGIDVVSIDLERLRDSNPLYSPLWRLFGQWWGNSPDGGSWPNPFAPSGRGVTLRSWLALLNFKANHRKVIVADRGDGGFAGLVTSANPHDASSGHSNVAVRFSGELVREIAQSEMALARISGWQGHVYISAPARAEPAAAADALRLSFLTEGAIRQHLVDAIDATRNGERVQIATFYLADRKVIAALLDASGRGVQVRLILDPNRDAFGYEKDGVPNRPVANELVTRSGERIEVRWYKTHGEQFHTKLAMIVRGERFTASLGSANLTRRNIGNYNLEANIGIDAATAAPLAQEMLGYFDKLWNNAAAPGEEFTAPFGAYRDTDGARYWRYRLMEATGLSTF